MSARQNNFDLLRLLAALQVATWHISSNLHVPLIDTKIGWLWWQFSGVPIFFGISGFLVTASYLSDRRPLAFFQRRALRIYPGLWACLLLIEVAMFSAGSFPTVVFPGWYQAAWHVTMFVTGSNSYANLVFWWPFTHGHFFQAFPSGVLWTITVELQFYLLLPLILAAAKRARVATLGLVFVGSLLLGLKCRDLVTAQFYTNGFELLRLSVLPYLWVFMIGVALQLYWKRLAWLFDEKAAWWLGAYLVLAAALEKTVGLRGVGFEFPGIETVPKTVMMLGAVPKTVLLVGTIIAVAHTWKSASRVLRGNDFSYGLYLYHMPLVWPLLWLGCGGQWWLWPVVLGGAGALAAASWFLVEQPCLALKRRGSSIHLPKARPALAEIDVMEKPTPV